MLVNDYIECGACRPSNSSQFWLPIFDKFFQFADAIFPNQGAGAQAGADVTYEDWKRVLQVTSPRKEFSDDFPDKLKNLRVLFFPTSSDYWRDGLEINDTAFPPKAKYKDNDKFPKLRTAYHVNGHVLYNRRADFLACYQDSQYIATYENIATHLEDLHCTTWFVVPNNAWYAGHSSTN